MGQCKMIPAYAKNQFMWDGFLLFYLVRLCEGSIIAHTNAGGELALKRTVYSCSDDLHLTEEGTQGRISTSYGTRLQAQRRKG